MEGRLLAGLTLLLLYALASTPTVEGQTSCAITSATIQIDPGSPMQFRDRGALKLTLDGLTRGARYTSVTWTRNGTALSSNSQFFIGGGEERVGGNPCTNRMYRPAIVLTGDLPGVYQYSATNADTPGGKTSPTLTIADSGPPSNLMLTQVNGRRVQASWTAPSNPVVDYRVFIDGANVNGNGNIVASGTTYNTTSQFGADTIVTIRVRATATYWSEVVMASITVHALLNPGVIVSATTTTSVTLTLSQPSSTGLPADQYIATLTSSACTNIPTRMDTTTTGSVMISTLEAGIEYMVGVTASNTATGSTSVTTITATTQEAAPSGPPGTPSLRTSTPTSIELNWTNIECLQQNGIITSFTIRYRLQGSTQDTPVNTQTAATSFNVTGLSAFTIYTFSVAGSNSIGMGAFSASADIRTAEDKPTAVRNLQGSPELFSVSLTWDEPAPLNGMLSQYTIRYSVNGSALIRNTTRMTTFIIIDLNPNTMVSSITVYATTGGGDGPSVMVEPNVITTLDRPPQVQGIMVEVLTDTSVRVSWDNSGFSGITDFVVYYRQTGSRKRQSGMNVTVSATLNSVDITNLVRGTEYIFEVLARAVVNGREVVGPRSDPATQRVITTTAPSGGAGSPVAAIAGGIIVAVVAVVALVFFCILILYLHRTGRLSRFLCCSSRSPKSGAASVTAYRYAPGNNLLPSDNHYYNNSDTFAPVIEEFPENTTAIEGEEVIFKVHISGKPAPTLTWKCGEQDVFTNYALTVLDDGSLTFPSAELEQSGVYELVAGNSAGSTQREVKLQIEREADDSVPDLNKQSLEIRAIPVDQFGEYVAGSHSNNNRGFRDQFQGLYDGEDKTKGIGLSPEFKKLNRFANITVYDDNRIELAPIPGYEDCQGPFINAGYVDGFTKPKKFIASQGPIPKTLVDFWRMIWQERPPIIVMVTNLKEGNKNKCQQYWPDTGSASYGPFKVTITEHVVLADYVIRTLQVSLEGSNRPFKLTQFHFTAWPDHGVPDYATPMLAFHRRVLSTHKGKKGPILVHCSAGVGRTGTFICIDGILEQIKKESVVDIAGTITRIRHQRMKMVQTPDQYVFLHDAILESVRCGDTQIGAANLRVTLHKYGKKDPQTGLNTFQSQFDVLEQVSPKISEVVCTAATRNQDKNRSMKYLPSDRFRVIIKGEAEDYIHAAFAHGYKQQKAYIIAENPMASTVPNLLKVLYNRKCGAVVMLSALEENGQEACSKYWPTLNEMARYGDFVVDLISEEVLSGFTIRNISILHEKTRKAHQVMQFHITCWQPDGQCTGLRSVVDTIEEIAKVQRKTGNKPIFVHCSDTVTRSGMFCALATIIDRCKTEGVVDVFQVVKALRIQKPGAVPTVHDYSAIFEATLTFLDSFDTYANFQN